MMEKTYIVGLLDKKYVVRAKSKDAAVLQALEKHSGDLGSILTIKPERENTFYIGTVDFLKRHGKFES